MTAAQGAVAVAGLLFFTAWCAAGVGVFRAWLDGAPPGGIAATFAALATFAIAFQIAEQAIRRVLAMQRRG